MATVSESDDIRRSLRPIFISTWLFGVPRVSYKLSYRLAYSILATSSHVATFLYTIDERLQVLKGFPINAALYVVSQVVVSVSLIGTILFWITKGAQSLEVAITELAELDVELKSLGIKIDHQHVIRRQIWSIIAVVTLWGIIITIQDIRPNSDDGVLKIVCTSYSTNLPHLLILFGEFVFSIMMYSFCQRFELINRSLRVFWRDEERYDDKRDSCIFFRGEVADLSITKVTLSTDESLNKIKRLYKTHQRLCRLSEKLNFNFSSQLYFTISTTFTLLAYRVILLYTLTLIELEQRRFNVASTILWIIFYILKFWTITLTCYFNSVEANKFGTMLHGIEINDPRFHRMLHVCSVQLYQNKLQCRAGGFFNIDLSLVSALISTVTTYIVVVVDEWTSGEGQFKNSTDQ